MTTIIDGNEVADNLRADIAEQVETAEEHGVTPGLATVLMSDDAASETYVSMKRRDCEEVGIESHHVEISPDAPAEELYGTIDDLNQNENVHGILVQLPVPDHVDDREVLRRIDPVKDVDGFHPENVGRLVSGNARYKPCTPHGVQKILQSADIETEGKDITIVGRSNIVGKPLANMFVQKEETGNATVTICHSRTQDLAEKTRRADIVVAAVGVPEFIDGDMLSEGTTVIDVGVNRVEADNDSGTKLVGDVDFESAKEKADYITPVPGGVGPLTRAMLLYNTLRGVKIQEDVPVELP